ncbi:hypothetical protein D3C79_977510 [compost metagenome]
MSIDTQSIENYRQFVDQCDIQVTLSIFNNLGRLSDLDTCRLVRASSDNFPIQRVDYFSNGFGRARGNLFDRRYAMLFVTWIYAFRAVACEKILIKH